MDNRPIGVFDSGLGGLSTVRAMLKFLPNEDIVYFGDTGRVPYGTRSKETIETYAAQDIKFLKSFNCKMIVAACGTVSTVATVATDSLTIPYTGITGPASKVAALSTKNNKIGIIGTSATVSSGAFDKEIKKHNKNAITKSVACPILVNLVENNWIAPDDEITLLAIKRYLKPIMDMGADTLILGCTHFPILIPIIKKVVGDSITLIDTGLEEAKYVDFVLNENNIKNDTTHKGECKFFVSDKTQNFSNVANTLLGEDISNKVSFVDILRIIYK